MIPAWAWVTVLVVVSAGLRLMLGLRDPSPWIFQDELLYSELAKSFAATGHFAVRETPGVGGFGFVYPALISPAWALFDRVPAAYDAAKAINAVLMSLSAIPVYLIARRVAGTALALLATVLALALPAMIYTSTIMTENAFYPVFLFWAWALVLALDRPTIVRQLVAVGLTFLAYATRNQGVVLAPALVTAIVLFVLLEAWTDEPGFVRRALRGLAAFAATWVTLGVGAAAYFSYEIGRQGKTFSNAILGAYSILGDSSYSVRETLRWSLYHLGELDLAVGILPFAAFVVLLAVGLRRHPPSRQTRVFAVVALSATVWLTLEVGAFASTAFGRQIQERNLFYLEPLFLIALVVWAGKRLPRSPVANGAGAVTAAALVALVPYPTFLTPNAVGNAFGLLPLFRLEQHGWVAPAHLTEATTLFALAAGLVFVLLPYRLALVAPALVLVYLAGMNSPIEGLTSQASRDSRRGGVQNARDWIDRKVGTAPRVAAIWSNTDGQNFVTLWDNEFFNRSVGPVYNLKGSPDGLPQQTVNFDTTSGVLHDAAGAVLRMPYVLTDRTLGIAGQAVARDNGTGMVLYHVGGPDQAGLPVGGDLHRLLVGAGGELHDLRLPRRDLELRAARRPRHQSAPADDRRAGPRHGRASRAHDRAARPRRPVRGAASGRPGGVPHLIRSHSDSDPGGNDGIRRYAGPRDPLPPPALPARLDPGDERVLGLADPVSLGVSAAARIDDLRFGEPVDQRQRAGHLREDRRAVGRVDPERLEGLHGVGVHRLGDEQPAWPQGSPGERQQALELVVGQMLDHVDRGDRAEASFGLGFEVGDGV